jgi:hypothetical protein
MYIECTRSQCTHLQIHEYDIVGRTRRLCQFDHLLTRLVAIPCGIWLITQLAEYLEYDLHIDRMIFDDEDR